MKLAVKLIFIFRIILRLSIK